MKAFGYHWSPETREGGGPPGGMPGGPPGMQGGPNMGQRPGGFPGGPGMPGMPGAGQLDAKERLARLVAALDHLTGKPLVLTLTEAQKARVLDQLKGLAGQGELTEEEAAKKLKALLGDLEDQTATLKAAGFSVEQKPRPPVPIPNPFMEEENKKHLEALEKKLAKPKS